MTGNNCRQIPGSWRNRRFFHIRLLLSHEGEEYPVHFGERHIRRNPVDAYAQYFDGNSFLNPLIEFGACPVFLANVTFEPGCRNHWHVHHADQGGGQLLICTAGEGWYQEEGKEAVSLTPGAVITIPANVKHWHGAKKDSWFSHIAVEAPGENISAEWLEAASKEDYDALK